jgi:phage portal protein BeeE
VQPWAVAAKDAQLAEILKISDEHIALAFRIPQQILGYGAHVPRGSAEVLMSEWIATGLGFALNHVEESFGVLFALRGQPDEYVEFSTDALLRSAFKDRIEGLARAVQGGIFSPNEAREREDLPSVAYGDEPRVQQQVVPLSAAQHIVAKPGGFGGGPPPAPGPEPSPPAPAPKDFARSLLNAADEYDRRRVA